MGHTMNRLRLNAPFYVRLGRTVERMQGESKNHFFHICWLGLRRILWLIFVTMRPKIIAWFKDAAVMRHFCASQRILTLEARR